VDRTYEIENLRRSIAIAPPRSMALDREQAMALLAELYEALLRVRQVEAELQRVVDAWAENPREHHRRRRAGGLLMEAVRGVLADTD